MTSQQCFKGRDTVMQIIVGKKAMKMYKTAKEMGKGKTNLVSSSRFCDKMFLYLVIMTLSYFLSSWC